MTLTNTKCKNEKAEKRPRKLAISAIVKALAVYANPQAKKIDEDYVVNRFARVLKENSIMKETLTLNRALFYGGAATSLAILLTLNSIDKTSAALMFSTLAVSLALPLWIVTALIYESCLIFSSGQSAVSEKFFQGRPLGMVSGTAMASLYVAIIGLIWNLSGIAAIIFLVISLIALLHLFFWLISCAWIWDQETKASSAEVSASHDNTSKADQGNIQ